MPCGESAGGFEALVAMMDRLRGPRGCPWDRRQTYETLRGYLLEECHEVLEALDRKDWAALREELGDLLFQIVFLARLAKEDGHFAAADVVRGVEEKMRRRHPHVFGGARADTPEQVLEHWERIKQREKPERSRPGSVLDGIPATLPAMLKAQRLGEKAARVGFDWKRDEDLMGKIAEELGELRLAVARREREHAAEELGDVLFALVMLARRLGIDPEAALEHANRKFRDRFTRMEAALRAEGRDPAQADLEELDRLWEAEKAREGREGGRP